MSCDVPEGRFTAEGPTLFRNSNIEVVRRRLEPGDYKLTFGEIDGIPTAPSPIDLKILPGANVRIAARWLDVRDKVHPILYNDGFEGQMMGFTIIDQGTRSGPSAWFTDNGYLQQSSNIFGGSTATTDPNKPGTMAVVGSSGWTDYTMSVRMRAKDNDAVGVVFRFKDANNHYRFSWDSQRSYRRLTKTVNGVVTILDQKGTGYVQHKFHDIRPRLLLHHSCHKFQLLAVPIEGPPCVSPSLCDAGKNSKPVKLPTKFFSVKLLSRSRYEY